MVKILSHQLFVQSCRNLVLILFIFALAVAFFIIRIDTSMSRLIGEIWNLGHLVIYMVIVLVLYWLFPAVQNTSWQKQMAGFALLAFLSGLIIEAVQALIGRYASVHDIALNVSGAVIAVLLISRQLQQLAIGKRLLIYMVVLIFVVSVLIKPVIFIIDDMLARNMFPVLEDFNSSPFAGARWQAENASMDIVSDDKRDATRLKINFTKSSYSSASFLHFPRNWTGYEKLNLLLNSASSKPFELDVSIHDRQHELIWNTFNDRYNRKVIIEPGDNHIVIDLSEVKRAPRTRDMNMQEIKELKVLLSHAQEYRVVFINKIYLE